MVHVAPHIRRKSFRVAENVCGTNPFCATKNRIIDNGSCTWDVGRIFLCALLLRSHSRTFSTTTRGKFLPVWIYRKNTRRPGPRELCALDKENYCGLSSSG